MKCHIVRWIISGSIDRGKIWSNFAERHLDRCPGCREYVRMTELIDRRAREDAQSLAPPDPGALNDKIISGLTRERSQERRKSSPYLVPIASSAVVLLAVSFILIFNPFTPGSLQKTGSLSALHGLLDSGPDLVGIAERAETAIDDEYIKLESSIKSAASSLFSRFVIRIGPLSE